MNLTLRQVRAFLAVVRTGNFTRAAQQLQQSQPALTVQIRQLEHILGMPLFDRHTRQVDPTRVGRELALHLERIHADLMDVVQHARHLAAGVRGIVRVSGVPSLTTTVVPKAIALFQPRWPEVRFVIQESGPEDLLHQLQQGEVDFALTDSEPEDPQLVYTPLLSAPLQVLVHREHPLVDTLSIGLNDLVREPLSLPPGGSAARAVVNRAFKRAGLVATRVTELGSVQAAATLTAHARQLAVYPMTVHDDPFLPEAVLTRPLQERQFLLGLGALSRRGRSLPAAARTFLSVIHHVCTGDPSTAPQHLTQAQVNAMDEPSPQADLI